MQTDLFAADEVPAIPGLRYEADFLGAEEEAWLLDIIRTLPLHQARYKQYLARRQVVSFGGSYDFDANMLRPGKDLDERLVFARPCCRLAWCRAARGRAGARGRVRAWHALGLAPRRAGFRDHRWGFAGQEATIRFRQYPPDPVARRNALQLGVAPRSIYEISSTARWGWQHCVPPVAALRWSITFCTSRDRSLQ